MMNIHDDAVPRDYIGKATWFAAGILFGAAAALLTSPASGRKNRKLIKQRAQRLGNHVAAESNAFIEEQRTRVDRVMRRGREEAEAIGEHVNDAITHGKSAYLSAREELQGVATDAKKAMTNAMHETAGASRRPTS